MRDQDQIRPDTRVRIVPNVHFRRFDDELVLLDLARGDYFALNEVGAAIWSGIVDGLSPEQIVTKLGPRYSVTPDELLADCLALIEQLVQNRLVAVEGP